MHTVRSKARASNYAAKYGTFASCHAYHINSREALTIKNEDKFINLKCRSKGTYSFRFKEAKLLLKQGKCIACINSTDWIYDFSIVFRYSNQYNISIVVLVFFFAATNNILLFSISKYGQSVDRLGSSPFLCVFCHYFYAHSVLLTLLGANVSFCITHWMNVAFVFYSTDLFSEFAFFILFDSKSPLTPYYNTIMPFIKLYAMLEM